MPAGAVAPMTDRQRVECERAPAFRCPTCDAERGRPCVYASGAVPDRQGDPLPGAWVHYDRRELLHRMESQS
jgi:hypothetical protein